jgi:hypothetical protein
MQVFGTVRRRHMDKPGNGAAPYPAMVVDGEILVALSEFSLVPNSECK